MFIPVAHYPHRTIINETIVYSDTVLNLKELGSNIKLTTISDVWEYSLENCIKTILDANPNVTFNTIQYSKNDKKIYFYTNLEIDTKAWDESNIFIYEPLKSKKEILSEVNKLLAGPVCKKEDEIFKRIFVKIDNCPGWARAQFYVKRQDELTEYRRAENERKILEQKAKEKEMKRVRRREFAKKFFPFIKY